MSITRFTKTSEKKNIFNGPTLAICNLSGVVGLKYGWHLAEWLERLAVNAKVAIVLGFIPASSDTVESERQQMKQCWITYIKRKNPKNPPLIGEEKIFPQHLLTGWAVRLTLYSFHINPNQPSTFPVPPPPPWTGKRAFSAGLLAFGFSLEGSTQRDGEY